MRKKDITGQKFGKLTAIKDLGSNKHGNRIWQTKCECERIKNVCLNHLEDGHVKSCGCLKKDKRKDITGQKFGQLTAIKDVGSTKQRSRVWLMKCECEGSKEVSISELLRGGVISCGCSKKVIFTCHHCGKEKLVYKYDLEVRGMKYCSRVCASYGNRFRKYLPPPEKSKEFIDKCINRLDLLILEFEMKERAKERKGKAKDEKELKQLMRVVSKF